MANSGVEELLSVQLESHRARAKAECVKLREKLRWAIPAMPIGLIAQLVRAYGY